MWTVEESRRRARWGDARIRGGAGWLKGPRLSQGPRWRSRQQGKLQDIGCNDTTEEGLRECKMAALRDAVVVVVVERGEAGAGDERAARGGSCRQHRRGALIRDRRRSTDGGRNGQGDVTRKNLYRSDKDPRQQNWNGRKGKL